MAIKTETDIGVYRHGILVCVQDEDNIHMPKSKRVKRSHVAFIDD